MKRTHMARAPCLLLALCLALGAVLPVDAADPTADLTPKNITLPNGEAAGDISDITITATIEPTRISVTVPTQAAFDLDPTADTSGADGVSAQIKNQPSNLYIENNTGMTVYVRVKSVTISEISADSNVNSVDFVTAQDAGGGLTGAKDGTDTTKWHNKMMFALKNESAKPSFAAAAGWLTDTVSGSYYLGEDSELGAVGFDQTSAEACRLPFQAYGMISPNGWQPGDSFKILPTFTVSLTPFDSAAP